jgi:hypothetical protein
MALIIPPGFLQASYVFSLVGDSEPIVVTCGHEIDTASGASAASSANALFDNFADTILPNMNAQYVLEYVATYAGNDGPTIVTISTVDPVPGGGSAAIVPQNTAYLIRKRTDLAGRRGRGRMYLPSVAEQNVDAVGIVAPSTVTSLQAAFDAWMLELTDTIGNELYPPVILHRSEGIGEEPPPTPVVTFVVENRVATQRRRLRP